MAQNLAPIGARAFLWSPPYDLIAVSQQMVTVVFHSAIQ
jgi:hypothetical protein